jgi:hypothetical protein
MGVQVLLEFLYLAEKAMEESNLKLVKKEVLQDLGAMAKKVLLEFLYLAKMEWEYLKMG